MRLQFPSSIRKVGFLALLFLGSGLFLLGTASSPVSETSSNTTASDPVSETSSNTAAASGPVSETSSNTTALRAEPQDEAQITPTYVSELAPAVMLAPEPAALPVSGVNAGAGTPWPKATGLALALLGGLFIYAARAVRTEDTQ